MLKLSSLECYLIHTRTNLRSNFCNHRRLSIFRSFFVYQYFWIEGWGIEILTMIGVQKFQFLTKSENWTNVYTCCSCILIVWYIYWQFGLSSKYSYNKNWTAPYFIKMIINRANFAVRGPTSLESPPLTQRIKKSSVQKSKYNMFYLIFNYM